MKILNALNTLNRYIEDLRATLHYPRTIWEVAEEKARVIEAQARHVKEVIRIVREARVVEPNEEDIEWAMQSVQEYANTD
jgi:hypothetical protein